MDEIEKHMPDLHESLQEIEKKIRKNKPIDDIWEYVSPQSIDYGLLEKSTNIYVVSCGFQWNDLGSWNALYDVLAKNDDGNIIRGNGKILEGTNNFIQSDGKFTAVVGVDDLVLVNTDDITLAVHRDKVEMVKDMVNILKKEGKKNLL